MVTKSMTFRLAKLAGRLPRGSRHLIRRIAAISPELQDIQLESRHGPLQCDLRESVCLQIFRLGGYKHTLEEEAFFNEHVGPNDVVFDVGANIGYMAIQFARSARHVHLFEPAPRAVRLLRKTVRYYPNMTLHPVAVSDKPGSVHFREEQGLDVSHVAAEGVEVPSTTLDSIGITPTFIKIDVEGHEQAVLRGASRILGAGPVVFFEALSSEARDENEAILKKSNPAYRVERIAPGNRNFVARVR